MAVIEPSLNKTASSHYNHSQVCCALSCALAVSIFIVYFVFSLMKLFARLPFTHFVTECFITRPMYADQRNNLLNAIEVSVSLGVFRIDRKRRRRQKKNFCEMEQLTDLCEGMKQGADEQKMFFFAARTMCFIQLPGDARRYSIAMFQSLLLKCRLQCATKIGTMMM